MVKSKSSGRCPHSLSAHVRKWQHRALVPLWHCCSLLTPKSDAKYCGLVVLVPSTPIIYSTSLSIPLVVTATLVALGSDVPPSRLVSPPPVVRSSRRRRRRRRCGARRRRNFSSYDCVC